MALTEEVQAGDDFSDANANEPFHIKSAVYDSGADELQIEIGHGLVTFKGGSGGNVLESSDTTVTVSSPNTSTKYYIYLQDDGTFRTTTTRGFLDNGTQEAQIGNVTTKSTLNDGESQTRRNRRSMLPTLDATRYKGHDIDPDGDGQIDTSEIKPSAISRGKLKTTTSSSSGTAPSITFDVSLNPYSFFPGIEADSDEWNMRAVNANASVSPDNPKFALHTAEAFGGNEQYDVAWRHVQASPPYDLGDGVVGNFLYVELDGNGNLVRSWSSQDPPWAGRHTTLDLDTGEMSYVETGGQSLVNIAKGNGQITHTPVQNDPHRFMDRYPHPFLNVDPTHEVVLLDPVSPITRRLFELNDAMNLAPDEPNVSKLLTDGFINIGSEITSQRSGPSGISIHDLSWA